MIDTKKLLFDLSNASGVTGLDGAVSVAEGALTDLGLATERDQMGGLTAVIKGGKKRIMLDAHIDEVGMIVTAIDGDFLRVAAVGGLDERLMVAQEVTVHGQKDIFGVFTSQPPHVKGESSDAVKLADIAIDTGYSHDELCRLVQLGDRVSFRTSAAEMLDGRFCGKSLDNRAGCAAVIAAAESILQAAEHPTVIISLSAQEELGLRGARTTAFAVSPDEAVVVDVSFGDMEGLKPTECGKLGHGPMIGISPSLHRGVTDALINAAKCGGIAYQHEVMGGATSTNADVIGISGSGVRCGLISIPLRNMHTPVEVIDIDDVTAAGRLLTQYVLSGGAESD